MVELIGFIGNGLLAYCAVPLALQAAIRGRTVMSAGEGSRLFTWLWYWGEIFSLAYAVAELDSNGFLLMNYGVNILCVGTVLYYMYNPRGDSD